MSKVHRRRRRKYFGSSRPRYDADQMETIRAAHSARYETYVPPGKTIRLSHVMPHPCVEDVDVQINAIKAAISSVGSNKPDCYYKLGAIYWREKHDRNVAISYLQKAAEYNHFEAKELIDEIKRSEKVLNANPSQKQKLGEGIGNEKSKNLWLDDSEYKIAARKLPRIDYTRVELVGYCDGNPIYIVTVKIQGRKGFVPAAAVAFSVLNYKLKGQLFKSRQEAEECASLIKKTWGCWC